MKKIKYIFGFFVLFLSCGPGIGDISEELGGGYRLLSEGTCSQISSNNVFKEGIYPNISKISFNKYYIIAEQKPNKKDIKTYLKNNIQSRYELILFMKDSISTTKEIKDFMSSRIWKDSIWHRQIAAQVLPNNNIKNSLAFDRIIETILEEDLNYKKMFKNKLNYYIIEKNADTILGPLTLNEFENLKKEKNIELNFDE